MMTGSAPGYSGYLTLAKRPLSRSNHWARWEGVQNFAGQPPALPLPVVGGRFKEHSTQTTWPPPKPVLEMTNDRLKIFTGNANPALAQEICQSLGMELGTRHGEAVFRPAKSTSRIKENVRGKDVFIVQPTCTPVERNLMELR